MRKTLLTRGLLCLLILVTLAGGCLTACDKKQPPNGPETTQAEEQTQEPEIDLYEDLRGYDFENKSFTVYTYDDSSGWYLYFDEVENSSEAVTKSAFRRNSFVEELLNVVIEVDKLEKHTEMVTKVQNLAATGDAPDLIAPYATTNLAGLVTGGYLYNIKDLDAMNLESEWYNQSANRNFSFKGKQYFFVSDYTYSVQQRFAYLANLDMIENYDALEKVNTDVSSIYELVKNGDWTFENLKLMTAGIYTNPNGGIEKTYDCTYGLATNLFAASRTYNNWGIDLVSTDDDGKFVYNLYSEALESVHSALTAYMQSQDVLFVNPGDKYTVNNDYYNVFLEGRAMFSTYSSDPWILKNDEYQEMHFAYLPYPKYEKEDEYITVSHGGLLMVPSTIKDADFVGVVTEALSRSSNEYIRDSFITNYFEARVIQDEEGIEMYQIMRDTSYYDLSRYIDPSKDTGGSGAPLCSSLLYLTYPLRESRTLADRYASLGEVIMTAYNALYMEMDEIGG